MNEQPDKLQNTSAEAIERALRIGELRDQVQRIAGEPVMEGVAEKTPLEIQEAFWKEVLAFESGEEITFQELLAQRCKFAAPPLAELGDHAAVHKALWSLIRALASIRVFLSFTDHVSDRELYRILLKKLLPDQTTALPKGSKWNEHIDISAFPTDEFADPTGIYEKYYGPDGEIPLPYDRDRFLPSSER